MKTSTEQPLTDARIKGILTFIDPVTDKESNTTAGIHLIELTGKHLDRNKNLARVHCMDEARAIFEQMIENGIIISDGWKIGNMTKAYHQVELKKYADFI
jgi:pentatricopeptide repeat protein